MAQRYVKAFGHGMRPRHREVVAFLRSDAGLKRAFAKYRDEMVVRNVWPEPRLEHYHYHYRLVAKRCDGVRLIEAPKSRLKDLQRQVLRWILEKVPPHPAVHGFVRGRSIRTFRQHIRVPAHLDYALARKLRGLGNAFEIVVRE